jgi:hypothetical protein
MICLHDALQPPSVRVVAARSAESQQDRHRPEVCATPGPGPRDPGRWPVPGSRGNYRRYVRLGPEGTGWVGPSAPAAPSARIRAAIGISRRADLVRR